MKHSYSSLKLWRTCPAQFRAKYIDRTVTTVDTPALQRGREVHDKLEAAVKGGPAPPHLRVPDGLIPTLQAGRAQPEQAYGMKVDGTPCGFWDDDVWLRGKIDVEMLSHNHAMLLDWKTGQYRVDEFQADVYATLLRALHPGLTVEFYFVYVDAGRVAKCAPDDNAERRVRAIAEACEADVTHTPRPCWACRFCPVRTCIHNGE